MLASSTGGGRAYKPGCHIGVAEDFAILFQSACSEGICMGQRSVLSRHEFVAIVAALMAIEALAIDIMLPALPDMGAAFSVAIHFANCAT